MLHEHEHVGLQPLTASLRLASLTFFCFTGFVVWLIEHRINTEFRGTPWQQFGLIFYFVFSHSKFSSRRFLCFSFNNVSSTKTA
jgi:glutamate receptor, ionotropic, plant